MYFSLAVWTAIVFFGYLISVSVKRKDFPAVVVNIVATVVLTTALVLDAAHLSSREEIAGLGFSLLAIVIANSYLLLRKNLHVERELDVAQYEIDFAIDMSRLEADCFVSVKSYYDELRVFDTRKDVRPLLAQWHSALKWVAGGKYEEALREFRALHSTAPAVCTGVNTAVLLLQTNKPGEATSILESLPRRAESFWEYHFCAAMVFSKSARLKEALQHFQMIPHEKLKNWKTAFYHGKCLGKLGEHNNACNLFSMAVSFAPSLYRPRYYLALSQSKIGKVKDALISFDRALRLDANDAALWYNRGNMLVKLGEYLQAVRSYEKAIERNPGYTVAWNNKGIALSRLGQIEEGIQCYRQALSFDSRYNEALLNCAIAFESLRQREKALEYYTRFLHTVPHGLSKHKKMVQDRVANLLSGHQRIEKENRAAV